MNKLAILFVVAAAVATLDACYTEHKVEAKTQHEVEIKPIQINIDINVKVDKALDDFFSDIDDA